MAARTITVLALSTPNSSHSGHTKPTKSSSLALPRNLRPLRPEGLMNSFLGEKLSLSSSNLCSPVHKRQCSTVKVFLSLPTANPEKFSKENMPKWSMKAIKAFAMGQVQSKKLGYMDTRTEGLLMGILLEGTSLASQFLHANGITHSKVKEEFIIKFDEDIPINPLHPPPSESALRALDWAIAEKLKSGESVPSLGNGGGFDVGFGGKPGESGEVTPSHMLLGVWSEKESGGHKIMATLGFDDEKAKAVAEFADKDG